MSTMLENASEVLFVLGILFTVAGVIFREIRRAKDPYKGRDRKSTRLNSSHSRASRMPSSA